MSAVLVIDFGTTNTVAVLGVDVARGAEPRPVTVDGAPWIPSAVYARTGGDELVVGQDAVLLGRSEQAAARFERRPKARMSDGELLLGNTVVPVSGAVHAVLERVVHAARIQAGRPVDELVLTHPADWGQVRIGVLLSAAQGLAPRVSTVAEPVGAAAGQDLSLGQTLLVVDFGGGTCDVAAVRREETGLAVLSCAGLPELGGDDLDQRIVDHLLAASGQPPGRTARARLAMLEAARAGKELLSRHKQAEVALPDHSAVGLTRTEFDAMIAEDVEQIVRLAGDVVRQAGGAVDRVLLVGGASRVPLLASRVAEAVGKAAQVDPEPETAVARGAMTLIATRPPVEESRPAAVAPVAVPPAPRRRRAPAIAALVVVVLLVAAAAVLVVGKEPASMPGQARAAAGAKTSDADAAPGQLRLPPAPEGKEVTTDGEREWTPAELGEGVEYRHPSGNVVEVVVESVDVVEEVHPYGPAPAGFRWVLSRNTLTNLSGPVWNDSPWWPTGFIDDRGQLLPPLDGGSVPCPGTTDHPVFVEPGATGTGCGVVPVPQQTPITALFYGSTSARAVQPAVRIPVDIPASGDRPAPAANVGRIGGSAIDVNINGAPLRVELDIVDTPSAYTQDRRPAPGTRFAVVRGVFTPTGSAGMPVASKPYLRDDRGALIESQFGVGDLPDCPAYDAALGDTEPVLACYLFEIDTDATISGLSVGWSMSTLTGGAAKDVERWPTWTV